MPPGLLTAIGNLAAYVLSRVLEGERARATLEERLQILEARRKADEEARKKFGLF